MSDRATALGLPVLITNGLFTFVALIALTRDGYGAGYTVSISAIYFLCSTFLLLMALTGTARDLAIHYIDHRTRRYHLDVIYSTPAEDTKRPVAQLEMGNFIPVADPQIQRTAIEWVRTLYLPTGEPDPHKVHMKTTSESPGRLRVTAPVGPIREFLLTKRVLHLVDHGIALDLRSFPDLRKVATALATP